MGGDPSIAEALTSGVNAGTAVLKGQGQYKEDQDKKFQLEVENNIKKQVLYNQGIQLALDTEKSRRDAMDLGLEEKFDQANGPLRLAVTRPDIFNQLQLANQPQASQLELDRPRPSAEYMAPGYDPRDMATQYTPGPKFKTKGEIEILKEQGKDRRVAAKPRDYTAYERKIAAMATLTDDEILPKIRAAREKYGLKPNATKPEVQAAMDMFRQEKWQDVFNYQTGRPINEITDLTGDIPTNYLNKMRQRAGKQAPALQANPNAIPAGTPPPNQEIVPQEQAPQQEEQVSQAVEPLTNAYKTYLNGSNMKGLPDNPDPEARLAALKDLLAQRVSQARITRQDAAKIFDNLSSELKAKFEAEDKAKYGAREKRNEKGRLSKI